MKLTIKEAKQLALKNYTMGGHSFYECYEDYKWQELIDNGTDTEEKLLKLFQSQYELDREYEAAAKWYAYGTTDESEIAEMLSVKSEEPTTETETEEEQDEDDYYDEFDDPCYGCQRMDGGYNCKHCRYGDDGNYSIYDVYRPSELL